MGDTEIEEFLDLRQQAETAPVWERAELLARAESIRAHAPPKSAVTLDEARASNRRRKLLAVKLMARRDGGTHAVGRDAEAGGEQGDGAACRSADGAVPQVVEGLGRDSEPIGKRLQRVGGGCGVQ